MEKNQICLSNLRAKRVCLFKSLQKGIRMKHKALLALCASVLLCSFAFSADSQSAKITSLADLNVTDELRAKHPLKPHHEKLSFTCLDCHEGQGNDASKFKSIGDKG